MRGLEQGSRNQHVQSDRLLAFILFLLVVLLIVSLFKNISYPLLWADESMTVMHGTRVLEYGYPKVHDGKNVLYDLRHPNPVLGLDEKTDAYIGGANWGMYYFAVIGIKLAELTDDLYTRTAVIRSPFALAGLAGLLLLAFLGSCFFETRASKTGFLVLFVFFELLSIPLVLHLREARYYPLAVLFSALIIFIYVRRRILEKMKYPVYFVLMGAALFFLYATFSPGYFIFAAAIPLHEAIYAGYGCVGQFRGHGQLSAGAHYPGARGGRESVKHILPLLFSLIIVFPLMGFFRASSIAEELLKFNTLSAGVDSIGMYVENLSTIWRYFAGSDFIVLAIVLKFTLIISILRQPGRSVSSGDRRRTIFSFFLTVIFIVYFFSIAKIPNFLFTRYFIPLQPILALIIVLDLSVIYHFISLKTTLSGLYKTALLLICAGSVIYNISGNREYLEGHVYELTHQYKGPLDYVIPFIKERYKNTGDLVIATNYEETSFMYYLNARVIVGYVGNNLEQDSRIVPDIIVYRRTWGNFGALFSDYLTRHRYERISFPVPDWPVNNIPELNLPLPFAHRFGTEKPVGVTDEVELFVRSGVAGEI